MWCNRHGRQAAPVPAGESPAEEIRRLKRELAEARRANEILKAASAFLALPSSGGGEGRAGVVMPG